MGVARLDGKKWGYSGLFNPVDDNWGRHYFRDYTDGALENTNMRKARGFKKPPIMEGQLFGSHYFSDYADGELDETDFDQGVNFQNVTINIVGFPFGWHYFSDYADGVLTDTNMNQGVEFVSPPTIE